MSKQDEANKKYSYYGRMLDACTSNTKEQISAMDHEDMVANMQKEAREQRLNEFTLVKDGNFNDLRTWEQQNKLEQPEWDGEGYPNVGDIVNFRTAHYDADDWVKVEVRYVSDEIHVLRRVTDGLDIAVNTQVRNEDWVIVTDERLLVLAAQQAEEKKYKALHAAIDVVPPEEVASTEWYEHALRIIEHLYDAGQLSQGKE